MSDFSQLPLTLQGHTAAVYGVAFSPDGRWLLSGSLDTTARIDAVDVDDLVRIAHTRLTALPRDRGVPAVPASAELSAVSPPHADVVRPL